MDRRSFLKNTALGGSAAAATTLAAPAYAQGNRTLTMVTTWGRGLAGVFDAAQRTADNINGMADGALTIDVKGAGELVGVYAPNYILSASSQSQMRRNMAFVTMLMVPAAPAGYLFGAISDYISENNITAFGVSSSKAFGFQVSFAVCAAVILLGILVAVVWLPGNPGPVAEDEEELDEEGRDAVETPGS